MGRGRSGKGTETGRRETSAAIRRAERTIEAAKGIDSRSFYSSSIAQGIEEVQKAIRGIAQVDKVIKQLEERKASRKEYWASGTKIAREDRENLNETIRRQKQNYVDNVSYLRSATRRLEADIERHNSYMAYKAGNRR